MKTSLLKKDGKVYIQLPEEFLSLDSAEFFKLRDGYYLLTIPLESTKKDEKQKLRDKFQVLSNEEKNVLRRLLSIKFHNRTPAYVEKILSQEEKNVLNELLDKNFINIFKSKKYPNGVYNINDKIYSVLYGKEVSASQSSQPTPSVKKERENPQGSLALLESKGYIIGTSKDLSEIGAKYKDEIKSGRIKGLKGFDGKFYIAKAEYVERLSPLIIKQLDREKSIEEIASNLHVESDAVRTVLHILAEAGDVIEKRRGIYAAI